MTGTRQSVPQTGATQAIGAESSRAASKQNTVATPHPDLSSSLPPQRITGDELQAALKVVHELGTSGGECMRVLVAKSPRIPDQAETALPTASDSITIMNQIHVQFWMGATTTLGMSATLEGNLGILQEHMTKLGPAMLVLRPDFERPPVYLLVLSMKSGEPDSAETVLEILHPQTREPCLISAQSIEPLFRRSDNSIGAENERYAFSAIHAYRDRDMERSRWIEERMTSLQEQAPWISKIGIAEKLAQLWLELAYNRHERREGPR